MNNKSELSLAINNAVGALNKIALVDFMVEDGLKWKSLYMDLKDRCDNLRYELKDNLRHAEGYLENMKVEGLTVNAIESEGYLRCAKRTLNLFEDLVFESSDE